MTKQKTEENPLSQQEVFDVLQFANQIYNNGFLGVYTPSMSNQNLISLNNNPLIPTRDSVEKSLKAYKESANILQSYSEFAEVFDKIYSRTLEYYANMLSFDLDIVCKNAYAPEKDYKSKEYKDDLNRVYKFLDNFDYKGEFLRVTKQMLRNETYFTWFRDSQGTFGDTGEIELDENGDVKTKKMSNYTLQIIPQERCLLTGMWEKGLLFDFDMNYFLKAGVDINSYDPVFKKYWRDVFGGEVEQKYNPTAPLDNRNGSFALWTQTSPEDGSWVNF